MLYLLISIILFSTSALAKDLPPPPDCNIKPTEAVTTPAPVDLAQLVRDLNALKTQDGQKMLEASALRPELQGIFDTARPNSKLQQFYRLLHLIATHSQADIGKGVDFDLAGARKILMTSRVFPDEGFPARITAIHLVSTESIPEYTVSFSGGQERFPLNQGKGFRSWEDNYCQHAKALVFAPQFAFRMKEVRDGNLKVYNFRGVDLFGEFGTRGAVDVDLKYVRLSEVEFFKNSQLGRVKAYISRREFQQAKHSRLLRLVSQIIPNTSVQAIDW